VFARSSVDRQEKTVARLHKDSRRQEERVASRFGGRRTPGSGNQWDRKNDVRTSDWSFELKTTGKKQYTLKASELEDGEKQALLDGRNFAFGIEMNGRNWVVLSEDDFAMFMGERDRLITLVDMLRANRAEPRYPVANSADLIQRAQLNAFDMVLRVLRGENPDGT
jgi:hypothetical protein